MRELQYVLLDVFTDKPFGGNQLAVFLNGADLTGEEMQMIAKELNLSETVFLFPPSLQQPNFKLRIFTPGMELPYAGHPTIGTAFLLGEKKMVTLKEEATSIVLQENIGPVHVKLFESNGSVDKVEMEQPPPRVVEEGQCLDTVAKLLSLSRDELHSNLPIQSISAGIPFLYVPVQTLKSMNNINFRVDVWQKEFAKTQNNQHIFAFSLETSSDETQVHSRMFAPAMGITEDPATGSASGPLGFYLAKNNIGIHQNGTYTYISEQGIEMGRPSKIEISVTLKGDQVERVVVGGKSVIIGEGVLKL